MRWVAALVLALLVVAPVADGKKRKRSAVTTVRAKAPKRWKAKPGFPRPVVPVAPAVTAVPTAPAPAPVSVAPPPAAPTPPPVPAPDDVPVPSPRSVSVVATEWAFTLSQPSVAAGDVRVQFDNTRAEDPHQLVIVGGDERFDAGTLAPGRVERVTVPLTSGTYALLCPLPEHEARGMRATLVVR